MEALSLTSEQERKVWEFEMELAFHDGMPQTLPPDDECLVEARALVPLIAGGAACALELELA